MKLFDFAFCHGYDRKIQMLSGMCPEKWSFGGQSDNVILKNYIEHMFSKVEEEGNIIKRETQWGQVLKSWNKKKKSGVKN